MKHTLIFGKIANMTVYDCDFLHDDIEKGSELDSLPELDRQGVAIEEDVCGIEGHVVARHIPYTLVRGACAP